MVAEYQRFEQIATLCAHLAAVDPRFATVGRRAEDRQFLRGTVLESAGFDVHRPAQDTARIFGRVYQLPDVTASVARELANNPAVSNGAPPPIAKTEIFAQALEDAMAETQTTQKADPNASLNGPEEPQKEETGFWAAVKRQLTVRNGVIAAAVVLVGTAIYVVVSGAAEDVPEALTE